MAFLCKNCIRPFRWFFIGDEDGGSICLLVIEVMGDMTPEIIFNILIFYGYEGNI
jgi:hypothetical protein